MFLLGQLVLGSYCVLIFWPVKIGSAGLGWQLIILYEYIELGPAAKPSFTQTQPELQLSFLCSVVDKDRDIAMEKLQLLTSSPT